MLKNMKYLRHICKFKLLGSHKTLSPWMGEGGYDMISYTYVPLPFAPLLPPPHKWGRERGRKLS
jgi:hypothetical protein